MNAEQSDSLDRFQVFDCGESGPGLGQERARAKTARDLLRSDRVTLSGADARSEYERQCQRNDGQKAKRDEVRTDVKTAEE